MKEISLFRTERTEVNTEYTEKIKTSLIPLFPCSLLWKQTEQLRRMRGGDIDKPVDIDPVLLHTFRKQQRHADFKTGNSIRNLLEWCVGAVNELAGFIETKRRVV